MYYLTYRPQTISDIDNTKVTTLLTSLLSSKKIPHAFLFVGQKGTGKTSAARIFAKSVNCLKNKFGSDSKSSEPCNDCDNCRMIDKSSCPDVLEMDAASNRGIDEMKQLLREIGLLPMVARYRVFIIDEAHMITPDAFNALLKTLEEPPEEVIFILATTNPEKLPKTIVSRTVVVNFGRASKKDIVHMLTRVVKSEKLKIDETLLPLIAEHAEHSFRDAAKLLEELVIQNKLTYGEAQKFLGIAKENLLVLLSKKNLKDALQFANDFVESGGNVKNLIEETLQELRLLLMDKNGVVVDVDKKVDFTNQQIIKLMKSFSDAYALVQKSPIESIPLEIAITESYNGLIN